MLLNVFFGPVVNAARGVAVQVQGTIGHFANNFQMAITPQITKTYASGNMDETHKLIYRGSKLTFVLMLVMCLPLIMETPMILNIWLKEVPEGAVLFLRLLLMNVIIQKNISILGAAVSSTGRIKKYETRVNGLMMTILPTAYIVLRFGGPAWTVFVVYLVVTFLSFILVLYISLPLIGMKFKYFLNMVIKPCFGVLVLSLVVPIAMKFFGESGLLYSLLTIAATILSTLLFGYLVGVNREEKQLIKVYLLKKLHR